LIDPSATFTAPLSRARLIQGDERECGLYTVCMASSIEIGTLIDRDPKVRGGRPKIAGTGLTVSRIAICYRMGMTPEEIALEYPHLTLAQVHAALAYYHVNRDEIECDIAGQEAEAARWERQLTSKSARP